MNETVRQQQERGANGDRRNHTGLATSLRLLTWGAVGAAALYLGLWEGLDERVQHVAAAFITLSTVLGIVGLEVARVRSPRPWLEQWFRGPHQSALPLPLQCALAGGTVGSTVAAIAAVRTNGWLLAWALIGGVILQPDAARVAFAPVRRLLGRPVR